MQSSFTKASTSSKRTPRTILILVAITIVLTIVVLIALTGHNSLGGASSFQKTPIGIQYRNPDPGLTFVVPPSWARIVASSEADTFAGSGGCRFVVLSHLVFIPTSTYAGVLDHLIARTHPGQTFVPYTSWQGSPQPDSADRAELKQPSGMIVTQNYIQFRRGASVVSLIESLPSQTIGCQAQITSIEKNFHLD